MRRKVLLQKSTQSLCSGCIVREHGIKRLLSRVADFIYRTRVLVIIFIFIIIIIITELSAEALRIKSRATLRLYAPCQELRLGKRTLERMASSRRVSSDRASWLGELFCEGNP